MNAATDFHLPAHLRRTVGNPRWMLANVEALRSCFPEQWVPMSKLDAGVVGHMLRGAGVYWQSATDLMLAMSCLQAAGIMRVSVGRAAFSTVDEEVVKRGPLVIKELP